MVSGGAWPRPAKAMGCLLLITFLVPLTAAHGGSGEDCVYIDGNGSDASKDAGPTPETSRDLYDYCAGHLILDVDEVDLMRDPLSWAAGTQHLYHIVHEGTEYGFGYAKSTLGFRLLWINDDQVVVLDEATLEEGEEHALWGSHSLLPDDIEDGRAYIEITIVDTEHTGVIGWGLHRHVALI